MQQGVPNKYISLISQKYYINTRLIICNYNTNLNFSYSLLNNSFEEHQAFQLALKQFVASIDTDYAKENIDLFVGFEGSFGSKHVTPRTLTSHFLGNLVCLEGIVTKCEFSLSYMHFVFKFYCNIALYNMYYNFWQVP